MQLGSYLRDEGITYAAFADRIGVANASVVWKYAKGRVPRSKKVMAAIIRETGGAVTVNDFFSAPAE